VSLFKTLVAAPLAPRARDWVVKRLVRAGCRAARSDLTSGSGSDGGGLAANTGPERGSLTLEGANLAFAIIDKLARPEAPRALVRLDGKYLRPDRAGTAPSLLPTAASLPSRVPSRST